MPKGNIVLTREEAMTVLDGFNSDCRGSVGYDLLLTKLQAAAEETPCPDCWGNGFINGGRFGPLHQCPSCSGTGKAKP